MSRKLAEAFKGVIEGIFLGLLIYGVIFVIWAMSSLVG